MRSRVLAIVVAVVIPLTALGVVISRAGSGHGPARLPILAGGSAAGTADAAARPEPALYPYGGLVYKAGAGLPELTGSARAYKVSGFDPAAARRLADALGFSGVAPDANNTFVKGDEQLSVSTNGYWGYVRQSSGGAGVSSSGGSVACAPDGECPVQPATVPEHPADLPSQDDAKATALSLLKSAGVDTTDADVNVDDAITQWLVRVDPKVDGIPTEGFTTTVTIGEKSVIEYANGVLGTPSPADEYPLIGTSAAIDRLNKGEGFVGPRPLQATAEATVGASGAPNAPVPDVAPDAGSGSAGSGSASSGGTSSGSADGSSGSASPPAPPASDSPLTLPPDSQTIPPPPPPQEVTITGAQRVLLFAASYTGDEGFLVPAYRFSTEQGAGPTVLAIDDKFLTPPDDLPVPEPQRGVDNGGAPGATVEPKPVPATASDGGR